MKTKRVDPWAAIDTVGPPVVEISKAEMAKQYPAKPPSKPQASPKPAAKAKAQPVAVCEATGSPVPRAGDVVSVGGYISKLGSRRADGTWTAKVPYRSRDEVWWVGGLDWVKQTQCWHASRWGQVEIQGGAQ